MKLSAFLLLTLMPLSAFAQTREFGYDRPGMDYTSFNLGSPRVVLCEWRCINDARCKAWTYVRPRIQGPTARCWLKYAVPPLVKNDCCDSGTK